MTRNPERVFHFFFKERIVDKNMEKYFVSLISSKKIPAKKQYIRKEEE